jgi:hypothetical protein
VHVSDFIGYGNHFFLFLSRDLRIIAYTTLLRTEYYVLVSGGDKDCFRAICARQALVPEVRVLFSCSLFCFILIVRVGYTYRVQEESILL